VRNLLLVARHEYAVMVKRRAFLLTTMGLPLLIGVIIAALVTVQGAVGGQDAIGYVDASGLLRQTLRPAEGHEEEERVRVVQYPDLSSGQAALEARDIDALFVVPEDLLESPRFDVYYWDRAPTDATWSAWNRYVRRSLLAGQPEEVRQRVLEGSDATLRSLGGRELREGDVVGLFLPIVAALLLTITSAMSSGYLLQALVGEKENRTIEVLVSAVTPLQLIGGKALGLMGVTLTQLAVWMATGVVALVVGQPLLGDVPPVRMPWDLVAVTAAFFVPTYVLLAAVMISISGMVGETRQAQAIAGPLTLPFIAPIMLMPLIFTNPQSPVLTALTLFPFTSFITITMRVGFGHLPLWQVAASWVLLVGTGLGSVWVAAGIFRLGMLRYGQRLGLQQVMSSLRAATSRR